MEALSIITTPSTIMDISSITSCSYDEFMIPKSTCWFIVVLSYRDISIYCCLELEISRYISTIYALSDIGFGGIRGSSIDLIYILTITAISS